MRYSSTAAALIAAMSATEVVAGPVHRVAHSHLHAKKNVDLSGFDWSTVDFSAVDVSSVDFTKIDYTNGGNNNNNNGAPQPSNGTPAPPTEAQDKPEDKPDTSNNDNSGELWHGLEGISNALTSFGASTQSAGNMGDFYLGNVGSPYCSNVIKVDSADGFDYTNNIINTSEETMTVVVWNKAGSDGQVLSGGALAPKEACLTFVLKPGQNQVVAFESDSQIGFAQATDDTTFSGHFATSFGECNLTPKGPACNLSAILNPKGNTYRMKITNAQNDCVSSNEENCWITETFTLPGKDGKDKNGSCWIPGAKGNFQTEMGGQE